MRRPRGFFPVCVREFVGARVCESVRLEINRWWIELGLKMMSWIYRAAEMGSYNHVMTEIEGLMQGEYESPAKYGKRAWRLFLQLDEAEESWVVKNFIAGVDKCEFRLKLQAEYDNQAMSLDAVIGRLKRLW